VTTAAWDKYKIAILQFLFDARDAMQVQTITDLFTHTTKWEQGLVTKVLNGEQDLEDVVGKNVIINRVLETVICFLPTPTPPSPELNVGDSVIFEGQLAPAKIVKISGKTANLDYLGAIVKKRLTSLKAVPTKHFTSDVDAGLSAAKYKAGDTAFSVLSEDGDGGTFIFTENGDIVKK
jgi:hypothetical protein